MGAGDRNIPVLKSGQDLIVPHEVQPRPDDIARKLYEAAQPAMVQVKTDTGSGSGFFTGNNGEIVASAHTVIGSREQHVVGPDGRRYKAEIKAIDDVNDIAILKIKDGSPRPEHKTLELGTAIGLTQDQKAYAFGYPNPYRSAYVSPGYVRHLTTPQSAVLDAQPDGGRKMIDNIAAAAIDDQTDMLNFLKRPVVQTRNNLRSGFVGGPILSENGKVIGITSLVDSSSEQGYSTPPEYAGLLLANAKGKFSFKYETTAAPWAEQYKSDWRHNQVAAIGYTALGAVGAAGSCAVVRHAPKLGGAGMAIASLSMLGSDGSSFLDSTDSADSWKHGLASLADTSTAGGALLSMVPRARPYGLALMAVGATGRVATEFIQNRWTLVETTRTDGTNRPPLDPTKYLR